MNINEVRNIIRQTIVEAIEEKQAKSNKLKSSNYNLMDLKTELKSLKVMQEALGQFNLSEGGDGGFVAEFQHMHKFVNEFNKLKEAHARLSEMLNNQVGLVEEKIISETQKIKEMMGLIEKAKKPGEKKEKIADKGTPKSKHEKGESAEEEEEEHDEEPKPKKKPAAKKPAPKKDK